MNFLDQARKLLTNFGQNAFNALPPVNAYNAVRSVTSPRFKQNVQQKYNSFASKPVPKPIQSVNKTLGNIRQSAPSQFGAGLLSGGNWGLAGSPAPQPRTPLQNSAYTAGSVIGAFNPRGLLSKGLYKIGAGSQALIGNKIASTATPNLLKKVLPIVGSEIAQTGTMLGLRKGAGQEFNPATDLAFGLGMRGALGGVGKVGRMGMKEFPGLSKAEGRLADSVEYLTKLKVRTKLNPSPTYTEFRKFGDELIDEALQHKQLLGIDAKEIRRIGRSAPTQLLDLMHTKATGFASQRAEAFSYGERSNFVGQKPPSTGGGKEAITLQKSISETEGTIKQLKETITTGKTGGFIDRTPKKYLQDRLRSEEAGLKLLKRDLERVAPSTGGGGQTIDEKTVNNIKKIYLDSIEGRKNPQLIKQTSEDLLNLIDSLEETAQKSETVYNSDFWRKLRLNANELKKGNSLIAIDNIIGLIHGGGKGANATASGNFFERLIEINKTEGNIEGVKNIENSYKEIKSLGSLLSKKNSEELLKKQLKNLSVGKRAGGGWGVWNEDYDMITSFETKTEANKFVEKSLSAPSTGGGGGAGKPNIVQYPFNGDKLALSKYKEWEIWAEKQPVKNLTFEEYKNLKDPGYIMADRPSQVESELKKQFISEGGGGGATYPKAIEASGVVQTGRKLTPQVETAIGQPKQTIPVSQPQITAGGSQSNIPPSSSSKPIIPQLERGNPVQRIITALKTAKPLEQKQGQIYHQIKSQQAGALSGIGEGMKGEKGYFQKLGQLKGELPKVQFESIRKQLSQDDVNEVFNMVEKSNLGVFEKVNAQTALTKLLGAEGGSVPTKGELELLNQIFPPEFIQAVMEKRSFTQKLFSGIEQGLNLPRAVMATADLSAPLRQGIFLIGRPKQWLPAFKNMFKYAFSEKAYKNFGDDIKARPNYKLYREAKLSITDTNPLPGSREETFMSNLADKIPGFGIISKGSNRAYSGFLNKLRVDTFDDLVKSAKQQGLKVEGKLLEDIASFVNSATGRGSLPKPISKLAPLLNATFFSPRLMASRINLLNPVYYAKLEPFVRKEALKSLVTFGGTAMTVLGLAKLGGAEVGADPRSADFGKIKVGNTRYDVLGGFQQYIRLATQLTTGQIVSSTTGKIITLGEGYKPLTRKDILMRFFENKESPVASFVTGLIQGTNSIGDKFSASQEAINRFIPMIAQDIYDLNKEWGAKGSLMAIPGLFGAGSQTYGKQELVSGKNQLGEDTTALQAPKGLSETINDKIFGQPVLGTTPQYSADAYYKQLLKLPKAEAAAKYDEIRKSNPELAKKIVLAHKDYQLGVTPNNETLRMKGVASGDRAVAISKEFNNLKTPQEKAALWDEYVKKKIITKEVAKQLKGLLK